MSFFLSRTSLNTFSTSIFDKHKIFLTKVVDYALWKNANFAFFLNRSVYCRERLVYYLECHQILFLGVFCIKRYVHKILYFCPKPLTKPFIKNANFVGFETDVFIVQKGLFPIANVENRFFTIYFHDLLGGYKGLQGVTKECRSVFLTRTFPDTFSWSILHENQS